MCARYYIILYYFQLGDEFWEGEDETNTQRKYLLFAVKKKKEKKKKRKIDL